MNLFLIRHGDAKVEWDDPVRPLSERGRMEVQKVVSHLARLNIGVAQIFHSGILRARQTAEMLAQGLSPSGGFAETEGLSPLDDPLIWAERMNNISDDIALVGHLPYLNKLASYLLCGDMDRDLIEFRTAGVALLKRGSCGGWSLEWMLTPDVL
ncbi:MAG: phosphohistidine phosphatase SixA [Nitrospirota bacterium]